jgi:hypothetical protein
MYHRLILLCTISDSLEVSFIIFQVNISVFLREKENIENEELQFLIGIIEQVRQYMKSRGGGVSYALVPLIVGITVLVILYTH